MNLAILLFVLIVLVILFIGILIDNRKKKPVKSMTWAQRGRAKYKAAKKAGKQQ